MRHSGPPPRQRTLVTLDLIGATVDDGGAVQGARLEALTGAPLGTPEPADDQRRAAEATRTFERVMETAIALGDLRPLPGAQDAIARLRVAGHLVCLTSGLAPALTTLLVEWLGWRGHVDLVVGPGPGVRPYPAPDPVLAAVMRLGVGGQRDTLVGGTRASAGRVVGVLSGYERLDQLEAAPHTDLIRTVAELPGLLDAHPVGLAS